MAALAIHMQQRAESGCGPRLVDITSDDIEIADLWPAYGHLRAWQEGLPPMEPWFEGETEDDLPTTDDEYSHGRYASTTRGPASRRA